MKIVATSDLHGHLPTIPSCDLLIIAGDVCPIDNHDKQFQSLWLEREFAPWIYEQPASRSVFIAGNHDFVMEEEWFVGQGIDAEYLEDSETEYKGLRIWGTPWVPMKPPWAFAAGDDLIRQKFAAIPAEIDIVVSHGPISGIFDQIGQQNVGSAILGSRMQAVSPALFISGHIHECGGQTKKIGETTFANVSLMDANFEPTNSPLEITLGQSDAGWAVISTE